MDQYSVNIMKDLKYDTSWVINLGFYVYDLNHKKSEGKWFHKNYLVIVIQKIMRSGFIKKTDSSENISVISTAEIYIYYFNYSLEEANQYDTYFGC